ncbi:MAG: PAS domain S-box protein, partial [Bacteroidota bacterium]
FTSMTGYTLDEIKGKKPKDFLQGKDTDPKAIEKIKEALWNKKNVEQTVINYNKFKQPYHNSLQITPVFDEQGKLKNFIAIQKDITKEIQAKQEILNINSRFELIANKSSVGIWEMLLETGKASWNATLEEQYGLEHQKLKADFSNYLKSVIHPEDSERVDKLTNEFVNSGKELLEIEFRIIRLNDQEERIIRSLIITERDANGQLIRLVGTNTDITDKKRTQLELEKNLQQQELLSETALELNNLDDFSGILNSVLNKVGNHTGVSRVYIFENIDSGNACNNTFEWCNNGVEPQLENLQGIPYEAIPYWKNELTTTGYIFSENIAELPKEVREILEPQEIKSILVFPLKVKGEFYGFIGFDECVRYKKWSKSEFALIKAFSGIISNTFERKISEDSLIASEKKYRSIIENINLGLVETDASGKVVFSNKQFHHLTQLENPSYLSIGNNPEDLLNREELKGKLISFKKMEELVYELNLRQKDESIK